MILTLWQIYDGKTFKSSIPKPVQPLHAGRISVLKIGEYNKYETPNRCVCVCARARARARAKNTKYIFEKEIQIWKK